jgi:hypothetical protein
LRVYRQWIFMLVHKVKRIVDDLLDIVENPSNVFNPSFNLIRRVQVRVRRNTDQSHALGRVLTLPPYCPFNKTGGHQSVTILCEL